MTNIRVYRDFMGEQQLVGSFEELKGSICFRYDPDFVVHSEKNGEFGISESLPLDFGHFDPQEYAPFFQGLLPEGETLRGLAQRYQVPSNDFLSFFEKLGCESIGALTFVSEGTDIEDFDPHYEPVDPLIIERMRERPAHEVIEMTDDLRLSLAGAQSKVAWYLPDELEVTEAHLDAWRLPKGTAPSSHIVKIARKGEEDIALNELVCMRIAERCGFDTPVVNRIPFISGAIAVRRYDRIKRTGMPGLIRLHQEDFCQARGLPLYLKYANAVEDVDYVAVISELIQRVSNNPLIDKLEVSRRLLFHYLIGNTDNHLKNYAFLYSPDWRSRRLAPLYDVTCIPLTGYSTKMAFSLGDHRELMEITAQDLMKVADSMRVSRTALCAQASTICSSFRSIEEREFGGREVQEMAARILRNSKPRLAVLDEFVDLPC